MGETMKRISLMITAIAILGLVTPCEAQRPGGQRGGGPQRGGNLGNLPGGQPGFGNRLGNQAVNQPGLQNANLNLSQLAQRMIANFDADGSGELGLAELQMALQMASSLMQHRGGQNRIGGAQAFGFGNQQNGPPGQPAGRLGREARQGNPAAFQRQGNRPRPGNSRRNR